MQTISEMLGGSLYNRLNTPKKRSGFFDLSPKSYCEHPEHKPPIHICIPQGKGYRHVCPQCGHIQDIIPPQISF